MIGNEDMIRILGCIPNGDTDQLDMISRAISSSRDIMASKVRKAFHVGDRVMFESKGVEYHGEILKIMRKNIKVRTDGGAIWTVYPSFLKVEVIGL